jgi:hypothetical protein
VLGRHCSQPGIIDTRRAFRVEPGSDPRENLDCSLWVAGDRAHEPTVPGTWLSQSFRQHFDEGKVPGRR